MELQDTATTLDEAAAGLMYQSESDEPFEAFEWLGDGEQISTDRLLELTCSPLGTPIVETSFEDFFDGLTKEQSWFGEEERNTAEQFSKLKATIEDNLSRVRVFRLGEVQVAVYIVGITRSGNWAGLKTLSIET